MKRYTYTELDWDSKYFDCKSSRIDILDQLDLHDIDNIKKQIMNDKFVTISNAQGLIKNNDLITEYIKGILVDTNVQFVCNVEKTKKYERNYDVRINNFVNKSIDIINMTKYSFTHSRFMQDKHFSIDTVNGLYESWLVKSFDKKDKFFCTYQTSNKLLGYILFSFTSLNEITIELLAVDLNNKNKGIGSILINNLLCYASENKIDRVLVGTQLENINAINFYIKNGFKLKKVQYLYHRWV